MLNTQKPCVSSFHSVAGDFSRASHLFSIFIGKNVAVDVDGCLTVEGRLIHYCESVAKITHLQYLSLKTARDGTLYAAGFRMIRRLG